ncbi:hypothetical protein AAFC00_006817 [Neodothiora populina]|uniref:Mitochondrial ATPase inhibitor n=1 Tax=Neodothiora populina TaxID=2781224 RepID=A0ABR3PBI1_9PEZI
MLSRSFIARRAIVSAPVRSFQTSRAVFAGKEDALHHEGRAEEAEQAKQAQLKKQKEGKGEWHDELASNSESIIKADRGEIKASKSTIDQLQKETAHLAEEKAKSK